MVGCVVVEVEVGVVVPTDMLGSFGGIVNPSEDGCASTVAGSVMPLLVDVRELIPASGLMYWFAWVGVEMGVMAASAGAWGTLGVATTDPSGFTESGSAILGRSG